MSFYFMLTVQKICQTKKTKLVSISFCLFFYFLFIQLDQLPIGPPPQYSDDKPPLSSETYPGKPLPVTQQV